MATAICLQMAAVGCDGPNPVLIGSSPDPTPLPLTTPTPNPADLPDPRWHPVNKAEAQWATLTADRKKALVQGIQHALYAVLVETPLFNDSEITAALVVATKNTPKNPSNKAVQVMVILDGSGANRDLNLKAFNDLQSKGIIVQWAQDERNVRQDNQYVTLKPDFRSLQTTSVWTLDNLEGDGNKFWFEGAMYALDHPLTSDAFAKRGAVTITTVREDITEAALGLYNAYFRTPYTPSAPSIITGPKFARTRLVELFKGVKTSLDLRVESLADPALIQAIGERAKAGLAIRVLLPRLKESQKPALVAAGIKEIRFADHVGGCLGIIDGKSVLHGKLPLDPDSIDLDRSVLLNLDKQALATMALAEFDNHWQIGQ